MSNATIERQTLLTAQLVFSDAEALVPKIAATVNDEVSRHHEVIASFVNSNFPLKNKQGRHPLPMQSN